MHKRINFLTLNRSFTNVKVSIRYKEIPICLTCSRFIEHMNKYPYELISGKHGIYKKIGKVNSVTGVIEYDLASICALNDNKCGNLGS